MNDNCNITNFGLKYLQNIRHLELYYNSDITDEGLKYLQYVNYLDIYSDSFI